MNAPPCAIEASLRRREERDWPKMLDLWVASWRVTYPEIDFDARRDWLLKHVCALESAGAVTLCLFCNDTVAGFVVINPQTGWLDQICVGPQHFGNGFGDALLNAAREASPTVIRLDVNADNARAIRFYERRGFTQTGRGANTLSGRETIVMEWRNGAN